jgi:hypothetical protein
MLSLVLKVLISNVRRFPPGADGVEPTKVIVMSATVQANLFSKYFEPLNGGLMVPHVFVGKKPFHVEEVFLDDLLSEHAAVMPAAVRSPLTHYLKRFGQAKSPGFLDATGTEAIAKLVLASVQRGRCLLVFLPGIKEIEDTYEQLKRAARGYAMRLHILHSVMSAEDQQAALVPATVNESKVVLATNIAETSITIPDVTLIIDCGTARRMTYNQEKGLRGLSLGWCSKSSVTQRAGRAGRVRPGVAIRLYTRNIYTAMPEFDASDFVPLEFSLLQMRAYLHSYGSAQELTQKLLEPPKPRLVEDALDRLVTWGALSAKPSYELLSLGRLSVSMPIDVPLTRAILLASNLGCAAEMIVIASGLCLEKPMIRVCLRPFFDNNSSFIKKLASTWKTIQHFDRGAYSDLTSFIAIYEEASAGSSWDLSKEWELAPRPTQVLMNLSKTIAQRLLGFGVRFSSGDSDRVKNIATGKAVEFPSIQRAVNGPPRIESIGLQLVLAHCAQTPLTLELVKGKHLLRSENEGAEALRNVKRTIFFDGIPPEIAGESVRDDDVRRSLSELFPGVETVMRQGRLMTVQSADSSYAVHYSLSAIKCIAQTHSARKTIVPLRYVDGASDGEGVVFPVPAFACKLKKASGKSRVLLERFSTLSAVFPVEFLSDKCPLTGFGFSVTSRGSSVAIGNAFLVDPRVPNLSVLTRLCMSCEQKVSLLIRGSCWDSCGVEAINDATAIDVPLCGPLPLRPLIRCVNKIRETLLCVQLHASSPSNEGQRQKSEHILRPRLHLAFEPGTANLVSQEANLDALREALRFFSGEGLGDSYADDGTLVCVDVQWVAADLGAYLIDEKSMMQSWSLLRGVCGSDSTASASQL